LSRNKDSYININYYKILQKFLIYLRYFIIIFGSDSFLILSTIVFEQKICVHSNYLIIKPVYFAGVERCISARSETQFLDSLKRTIRSIVNVCRSSSAGPVGSKEPKRTVQYFAKLI